MSTFLPELQKKLIEAEELINQCKELNNIKGVNKLVRKLQSELKFLKKFQQSSVLLKPEHLNCSNLIHLRAIIQTSQNLPDVTAILEPFNLGNGNRVIVDVVADGGRLWIKVIARNAQALHRLSLGQGQFGEKTVVDHAKEYYACSKLHLVFYSVPVVKFVFCNGVSQKLCKKLERLGIFVEGERVEDPSPVKEKRHCDYSLEQEGFEDIEQNINSSEEESSSSEISDSEIDSSDEETAVPGVSLSNCTLSSNKDMLDINCLNLDVTAMLAYISNLTNGSCWLQFREPILSDQAARERLKPVKPILDSLFKGKKLVCCITAANDFQNIISTLAGQLEKERAKQLLAQIEIVPDQVSEKAVRLQLSSQIKKRSKIVFGTGDTLEAITVTANVGFIRSAESQGVKFAVFIHESRALTEAKEKYASPIEKEISFQELQEENIK